MPGSAYLSSPIFLLFAEEQLLLPRKIGKWDPLNHTVGKAVARTPERAGAKQLGKRPMAFVLSIGGIPSALAQPSYKLCFSLPAEGRIL